MATDVPPPIREIRQPNGLLIRVPLARRFHPSQLFFVFFGLFFGGVPTVMLVMTVFFDAGLNIFAKIGIALFLSVFIVVGGGILLFGLFGVIGSAWLLVRSGRLEIIRKILLVKIRTVIEVKPGDQLRVISASDKDDALAGLKRIVIDRPGGDVDVADGIEEAAARAIAQRVSEELDLAAPAGTDDSRLIGEHSGDVAVAPIDRTERTRNVELESSAGYRHWKGTLVAAVVLDGIVTTIAVVTLTSGGFSSPVSLVFLGIFGLIAIVVSIIAVRHTLVAMKLGPAHARLSVSPLLLGEPFEVTFHQRTRASCDIENIEARLYLKETARYRRGTNTYTVTHESFETIAKLLGPTRAVPGTELTGTARFEIPTDAMHTFVQSNNRFEWFLEITIGIRKWPDATYSFPLQVWPYAHVTSADAAESE